ncbi:hypothetical protein NliqN6_2318 [Naganishia liquefaciens]|uniref:Uncharacterized protein n=1 Tax=Naganishia liquefaciens TaxID=104408 RepID=A0A8H3YFP3_9TREE|nr:hypothetical protein NliqN6_2318 [Naganishia liquefaciens]
MESIYTFDPLATPVPSVADTISQDESSGDESRGLDLSRLDNVYRALMSTLLDAQQAAVPTVEGPAEVDAGNEDDGAAAGLPKNAKRRKMDKKKAKREEQKRMAEETVDVVEFKLFSRRPVKPISLLPSEDPTWITPNPRHVPLTEGEKQRLRLRTNSVAVDGSDVLTAVSGTSKRKLEAYKLESDVPPIGIINLQLERALPPFSQSFALTHPGYTTTQPTKPTIQAKKSQLSSNPKLSADPIALALKRGPLQHSTRTAAHIAFTNNGKVLPAGIKGKDTSSPSSIPSSKAHPSNRPPSTTEKAHLRRIARRAHRLGLIPPPHPTHPHTHIQPSTRHSGKRSPWTNPYLGTHRFWAPAEEVGGKSGGYALGFAGSAIGVREMEGEGRRKRGGVYVRDRMR